MESETIEKLVKCAIDTIAVNQDKDLDDVVIILKRKFIEINNDDKVLDVNTKVRDANSQFGTVMKVFQLLEAHISRVLPEDACDYDRDREAIKLLNMLACTYGVDRYIVRPEVQNA